MRRTARVGILTAVLVTITGCATTTPAPSGVQASCPPAGPGGVATAIVPSEPSTGLGSSTTPLGTGVGLPTGSPDLPGPSRPPSGWLGAETPPASTVAC